MNRIGRFVTLCAVALTALSAFADSAGSSGLCRVCGKQLPERYLKDRDGFSYCSEQCFDTTLPVCAVCNRPCRDDYLIWENAVFCSRQCLAQVKPRCSICNRDFDRGQVSFSVYGDRVFCLDCARLPHCFACGVPTNDGRELPDGRVICRSCASTAVVDMETAQKLFDAVRVDLIREFEMPNDHQVTLHLVDSVQLAEVDDGPVGSDQQMRGYYRYTYQYHKKGKEAWISDETCDIFVLNYLPFHFMRDTMAHELTHHFIRHEIGFISELALEEGFCETLVSDYNIRMGLDNFNLSRNMAKDPIYGAGYRTMRNYVETYGWPRALAELRKYGKAVVESPPKH